MSEPYFTRGERVFYDGKDGQLRFRMTATFFDGDRDHQALTWDFPVTTRALGGEIPEPAYATEFFKGVIVDKNLAFFALFTTGLYAPGVEFDGAEDAVTAWVTEAQSHVLDQASERLEVTGYDESCVIECDVYVRVMQHREDGREGLLLVQEPPEDELQEVWAKVDGKWVADTVSGSYTIPVYLGVEATSRAWQAALDRIRAWADAHSKEGFTVHAETDMDFLAIEDDTDARKTAEFALDPDETL